jgi:predicted RNase H-like HicB family nuclease
MQTFLPYLDFAECARVLDDRRLGKQRVEVLQIARAITVPGYGWRHHPAVRMWRGYEEALGGLRHGSARTVGPRSYPRHDWDRRGGQMPLKVGEIIDLIETEGWYLYVAWKPPPVQASRSSRARDSGWQAERDVASAHRAEHPQASRCRAEATVNGYVVIVERDEQGGFSAWSPDLPGCVAAAGDYDEWVSLMRSAVQLHLRGMREDGEDVPEPTAVAALMISAA